MATFTGILLSLKFQILQVLRMFLSKCDLLYRRPGRNGEFEALIFF